MSQHTGTNDKRTTGKGNQVLVKVLLEALERGQTISACKVRKVVGVVYCVRALLPRHGGGCWRWKNGALGGERGMGFSWGVPGW
jgi:hypothetical protein